MSVKLNLSVYVRYPSWDVKPRLQEGPLHLHEVIYDYRHYSYIILYKYILLLLLLLSKL